jgi:hypothetical protein
MWQFSAGILAVFYFHMTLVKGVVGVDRATGKVTVIRVK